MVTKNNAYNYLDCVLTHNLPHFDTAFIMDDGSTDDTIEILRSHDVNFVEKPDFIPGLEVDETVLRFFAWITMFDALEPAKDDWIVLLDPSELIRGNLRQVVTILQAGGFSGAEVKCHFLWEKDPPMKRVDGLWDVLSSVTMASAKPGDQTFGENQRLPKKAYGQDCFVGDLPLEILNLSYVSELDKINSYDRLTKVFGEPNSHIRSILEPAVCEPIEAPRIWEGVR